MLSLFEVTDHLSFKNPFGHGLKTYVVEIITDYLEMKRLTEEDLLPVLAKPQKRQVEIPGA
jgi:hypothetical protein